MYIVEGRFSHQVDQLGSGSLAVIPVCPFRRRRARDLQLRGRGRVAPVGAETNVGAPPKGGPKKNGALQLHLSTFEGTKKKN